MKTIVLLISLLIILLSPFMGREMISFSDIMNISGENYQIFWKLRLANSLLAFLVGGVLSLAGLNFQSLFRNDLATPYTLGVASGASLGAVVALYTGISWSFWFLSATSLFSFAGGALAVAIVYLFAARSNTFDPYRVLLAGVSVGLLFSSFILLIQFLNLGSGIREILQWLMGSVSTIGYSSHTRILPVALLFIVMTLYYQKDMDMIRFNEEVALTQGVQVAKVKKILFILTSLCVAFVVAEVGPIGFVGLVVPHITRQVIHYRGRVMMIFTFLVGGALLSLSELVSRSLLSSGIIPIGIITALLGTPFFILILSRKRV